MSIVSCFPGCLLTLLLAKLQAVVRSLKVLTGPLCQGPWVNTAADWDLQQSLAEEKERSSEDLLYYSLPAFQSSKSLCCLPKSHVVYSSMWLVRLPSFQTLAGCNHVLVRGSYQQQRKEEEKLLAATQEMTKAMCLQPSFQHSHLGLLHSLITVLTRNQE